jgi:hypothetical protein
MWKKKRKKNKLFFGLPSGPGLSFLPGFAFRGNRRRNYHLRLVHLPNGGYAADTHRGADSSDNILAAVSDRSRSK